MAIPPRPPLRTRLLEGRHALRACVQRAAVVAQGPDWLELATEAVVQSPGAISSADLGQGAAWGSVPIGGTVTGRLRIELLSERGVRVRYAEGDAVPDEDSPMVIGRPVPPASPRVGPGPIQGVVDTSVPSYKGGCTPVTAPVQGWVLSTAALRLEVHLAPLRLRLTDAAGAEVVVIGGPERNYFNRWDAYGTGIQRADGPLATESFGLRPGHAVYGFGETFLDLDKRGQAIDLDTADGCGTGSPRGYKPVPFFVSTQGYGVFLRSTARMTAWVGARSAMDVQVAIEDDRLDYHLFIGSIAEVLEEYTALTGRPEVPPAWTFGWWQSKISYVSAAETLEVARRLRANRVPCDVIHLDTHWFAKDWYCNLEFDRQRFPDPAAYLAELQAMGFQVSLWQLPYVPEGSDYFAALQAVDGFVRGADGELWDCGMCFTPGFTGRVGVIDFTNPRAAAIYQERLRHLFALGAAVIKTDFGEDAPHAGVWHDGTPAHRMHNRYPLLYNQVASDATRAGCGHGTVWARAAWAGSQRLPIHWGGDNSPNWENIGPQLCGGLSLGLSGFTFWSQDIGGFIAPTWGRLLTRWIQLGVFLSHSRVHGTGDRELYAFDAETLRIGRDFIALRYRLLPYILGEAAWCAARGQPMMRPLVLDFQDDRNTWRITDQWLFGRDLLVAPIMDAGEERDVYLPSGTWTDWWTGERVAGGRWLHVRAGIERIPLWLREGAIVALGPDRQWVGEKPVAALDLRLGMPVEGVERRVPVEGGEAVLAWSGRHVQASGPARVSEMSWS